MTVKDNAAMIKPASPVASTGSTRPPAVVATSQITSKPPQAGKNYVPIGSRDPVVLNLCPKCSAQQVATKTETKTTGPTLLASLCCFFVCWPLCWVPCVCRPCKQTNHYCDKCGVKVGRVKPFQ